MVICISNLYGASWEKFTGYCTKTKDLISQWGYEILFYRMMDNKKYYICMKDSIPGYLTVALLNELEGSDEYDIKILDDLEKKEFFSYYNSNQ